MSGKEKTIRPDQAEVCLNGMKTESIHWAAVIGPNERGRLRISHSLAVQVIKHGPM